MVSRFIALVFPFILLIAFGPANSDTTTTDRFEKDQSTVVIAHRSASMEGQPENSLGWIARAIEHGVDMVHINPQKTADGHYVLMHDQTLNRMTDVESVFPDGPPNGPTRAQRGGKDYVGDYTLKEIRRLRLVEDAEGNTQPVPTLGEAIELVDGRALILLGLKSYEIESMAQALKGHATDNLLFFELFFSGTDQSKLRDLVDATGVPTAVTLFRTRDASDDLEEVAEQLGPRLKLVMTDSKQLSAEFVRHANELGLRVTVSGWDGREDYALVHESDPAPWLSVIENGHSATTDHPRLLLDAIGR
ncbi:MAG: glycerophosphodiester phosphodiesterase family protein [Boseongicola sp.]|nr:glycerophosphodiester phosphodiesterase family protein [Boseongicola sp.]